MKKIITLMLGLFSSLQIMAQPGVAAPNPSQNAADVISLFSNAYTNVDVDTWRTSWSSADLEEIQIAGNDTKKYSNLDFVGIETVAKQIDISGMTHLHIDVWSADFNFFGLKLVDFGADAAFGGGDDREHQVDFNNPALAQWVSLDIPISSFTGLTTKKNIAQMILVGRPTALNTVFVDNVFFYKSQVLTEPNVAAPTPSQNAADVISLFSNAYTNVDVDTWRTSWSSAQLEEIQIAGNDTKKYSNLDFVGIETVAKQIDISAMTHLHIDLWSADFSFFGLKLVDFGADSAFGGGDDREHQVDFNNPALAQWVSLDIPISSMTGLTSKMNIAQMILVGRPTGLNSIFIDNVYFYKDKVLTEPKVAAPSPSRNAADVISLFSNTYTNIDVDTWRTSWSSADLEEIQIAGNDTKKYSNLDFVGIETVAKQIDISGMTHLHIDLWSADFNFFGLKLVDFGADGAFGGGDDKEHQVDINNPDKAQWVSLDIPISSFTGLTTKKNIAQMILVGRPTGSNTVFVDNVYYYKDSVLTEPNVAAPTPSQNAADVISLFSNAYTNVDVDTWRTSWSSAQLDEIQIAGNDTKKYRNLDFVGIETVAKQIDISGMTHFHMDVWSADFNFFGIKLVDFGADGAFGGGDDREHQIDINNPDKAQWVSLDIPISSFTGLTTKKNIAQMILVGRPTGSNTVFVDNVYFYNNATNTKNPLDSKEIQIFPNPVSSGMMLQFKPGIESCEIYDVNGIKVITLLRPQAYPISLQKGFYLVRIKSTQGFYTTDKLIVE